MCCATGSLNILTSTPAFVLGEPTSQGRGKFTEIPHFAYMFVNLGAEKELRELQQQVQQPLSSSAPLRLASGRLRLLREPKTPPP